MMIPYRNICVGLVLLCSAGISAGFEPASIDGYGAAKKQDFLQISSATPASHTLISDPFGPYHFAAFIEGTSLNLFSPAPKVTLPSSVQYNLTGDSASVGFEASYGNKANMDSAFANGTYVFTAGTNSLTTTLGASDAYPAEIPRITNGTWDTQGRLVVNPAIGGILNFNTFTNYSTGVGGIVSFNIYAVSGDVPTNELVAEQSVALTGYASDPLLTSCTIGAGQLQPDQVYYAELSYSRLVDLNVSSLPALGMSFFMNATGFMISTGTPATVPVFTTHPASQTVTAGNPVTFTASASGVPAPTYQWQKGGVNIAGATSSSYSIASTVGGDAGSYTVVATNSAGSVASNAATLTVNAASVAPLFTTHPQGQTVAVGSGVTFTAAASGTPAPTYQWQKNNININGATGASYMIAGAVTGDAGNYTVIATNSAGSATSNIAVLTVNPVPVAPAITTQPISQTVIAGYSVTFTAAASGTPAPTYQWQKGGVNIAGATGSTYAIPVTTLGDAGNYRVVATNSAGTATSNTAVLTVNPATVAPVFTLQPTGQTVTAGANVTFTATASGTPAPTYQWQKGGVNIAGATGSTYAIPVTTLGDNGNYRVVATNSAGTATSNTVVLTVNPVPVPPTITTQPVSQTVFAGKPVTFTVVASGIPAPTYQWRKNGVNIAGAIGGSYTITATVLGDTGGYAVQAINSAGSVTSPTAVLTVLVKAADLNQDGSPDLILQNAQTGARKLWLMNGVNLGAELAFGVTGLEWKVVGSGDFNRDGNLDLLWQNTASGERVLWLMAGTNMSGYLTLTTVDPVWNLEVVADFNQDGHPDLLWQNTLTGERGIWLMNGYALGGYSNLGIQGVQWNVVGAGDFNADGKPDLVWQNTLTGERKVWLMNGPTMSSEASFGFVALQWSIGAVSDYNGDNKPDIFFQNTLTGEHAIWLMNGTALTGYAFPPTASTDWVIGQVPLRPAAADFNRDGKPDLLWQNISTGERKVWLMNGPAMSSEVPLDSVGPAWQIAGTGDFDGDGRCDILWQNTATGERGVWLMLGTNLSGFVSLGTIPTDWRMVGAADFNGDNQADILWQNTATGERGIWLMAGTTLSGWVSLGNVATAWQIAGVADFNRDDHPDLLWQNTSTGERKVWYMVGTTFTSEASFGTVALPWQMVGAGDYNLDGSTDIVWQNTSTGERGIWLLNGTALSGYIDLGTQSLNWQIAN